MSNVISYLKVRLSQGSTWAGISAVIAAFATSGGTLTPEVLTTGLTALGLLHVNG